MTLRNESDNFGKYSDYGVRYPKLDFNKVVTRDDIDHGLYSEKFDKYDVLMSDDKLYAHYYDQYGLMLTDPTLYAYAFLMVNGEKLRLYPYQDLIANDQYDRIIFCAANQIGKSFLLDTVAIHRFTMDHGKEYNQAIISKSKEQAKFQVSRIRTMLQTSKVSFKEDIGDQESMNVLTLEIRDYKTNKLKYINRIIVAPCTSSSLGYDLHDLYLDEFDFFEVSQGLEFAYTQWFEPRTFGTKGRITIFSNPNGKSGYMYKLWNQKNADGTFRFHRYNFNYMDRPGNTVEEFEALKLSRSRQVFESTVAAIFTDSAGSFFSQDEIEKSHDNRLDYKKDLVTGVTTFWFLDTGAKHDQSVLCGCYVEPDDFHKEFVHVNVFTIQIYPVGYPLTRVAGCNIDDSDGWHYEKSVKEYLDEYTEFGVTFGFDVTGNEGMKALFDNMAIPYVDIMFSGPKKSGMYQRFKWYMERGLFHRIDCKEFEYQMSRLKVKKSVRGYYMFHHESEDDLDDVCDACAGMIYLADNPDLVVPSLTFISNKMLRSNIH